MKLNEKYFFIVILLNSIYALNNNNEQIRTSNISEDSRKLENNELNQQYNNSQIPSDFQKFQQNQKQIKSNQDNLIQNQIQNENHEQNETVQLDNQDNNPNRRLDKEKEDNADKEGDDADPPQNESKNKKTHTVTITTSQSSMLPQLGMGAGIAIDPMANPLYNPFSPMNPLNNMGNPMMSMPPIGNPMMSMPPSVNPMMSAGMQNPLAMFFPRRKYKIKNPLQLPQLIVKENCNSIKLQAVAIVNTVLASQHKMLWDNVIRYLVKSKYLVGMTEVRLTRNLRKKIFGIMRIYSRLKMRNIQFNGEKEPPVKEIDHDSEITDFLKQAMDEGVDSKSYKDMYNGIFQGMKDQLDSSEEEEKEKTPSAEGDHFDDPKVDDFVYGPI